MSRPLCHFFPGVAMAPDATSFRDLVICVLVLLTAYTDLRYHRIRNVHTFPSMGAGLLLGGVLGGLWGLAGAFAGLVAGLVGMGILFAVGVMKAGDVKLAMALGALLGAGPILRTLILSFMLYLPVGLVYLIATGHLRNIWTALRRMARFLYTVFHPALEAEPLELSGMTLAPFGMVLGVAAVLVHFAGWMSARGVLP